ncbi:MAG: glycosyltransferase [Verrucomicrobia bacterium]|nr:glycosyltransferase [Verrucomicrobiota bacterium]
MIHFDVTKSGAGRHRSGLMRVNARLREELGPAAAEVRWPNWNRIVSGGDWFLTAELFSEAERPGFTAFVEAHPCGLAAIFSDAIPLKHPHITWPQSVARHPGYMKLLARFDRVWAISDASRRELVEFWQWQGLERTPPVDVLVLGADFNAQPRVRFRPPTSVLRLLSIGILEPRKNQMFLLDVCGDLWAEGVAFELHVVGRVNPHFGAAIVARIKALRRKYPACLRYHAAASDAVVAGLYATARATAFPTLAEGCGLPPLESLWMGVPCVCSDLPVLRENADGGGCLPVPLNDCEAWKAALRRVLSDDAFHAWLTDEATSRPLPRWADTAQTLLRSLR